MVDVGRDRLRHISKKLRGTVLSERVSMAGMRSLWKYTCMKYNRGYVVWVRITG